MASLAETALQYWKCDIAWRKAEMRHCVASDSGPRMVDRKLVSSEPALLGEQGSHCGHDCWSNGDKKHAVDNIVILYSI